MHVNVQQRPQIQGGQGDYVSDHLQNDLTFTANLSLCLGNATSCFIDAVYLSDSDMRGGTIKLLLSSAFILHAAELAKTARRPRSEQQVERPLVQSEFFAGFQEIMEDVLKLCNRVSDALPRIPWELKEFKKFCLCLKLLISVLAKIESAENPQLFYPAFFLLTSTLGLMLKKLR